MNANMIIGQQGGGDNIIRVKGYMCAVASSWSLKFNSGKCSYKLIPHDFQTMVKVTNTYHWDRKKKNGESNLESFNPKGCLGQPIHEFGVFYSSEDQDDNLFVSNSMEEVLHVAASWVGKYISYRVYFTNLQYLKNISKEENHWQHDYVHLSIYIS